MKLLLIATAILSGLTVHAQYSGGSGMSGGGMAGVGGTSFGGAMIARVNVAPYGGGFGFQGGMSGQGGVGGGLFGVTRPTFMAEPNTRAAQFFSGAGVRLPVREAAGMGGFGGGGAYFAGQAPAVRPTTGVLAASDSSATDHTLAAPAPAVPFAPPPASQNASAGTGSRPGTPVVPAVQLPTATFPSQTSLRSVSVREPAVAPATRPSSRSRPQIGPGAAVMPRIR